MRTYGQYCPMAMALEVLGDRWTLLIIRDLLGGGARFNDLARGLPGMSRTLLAKRLRQLEQDGLVERHVSEDGHVGEYRLTVPGHELEPLVEVLVNWGARWAFGEPEPAHLDPVLLLWWMRGGVLHDRLPSHRVVVEFDFRGGSTAKMWLLLDPPDVSVCLTPPGEVDLYVSADLAAFYQVWVGRIGLADAQRAQIVQLEGPPGLVRAFRDWWPWTPIAPFPSPVQA